MKLIDVKPIIFENSADDTFAEPSVPATPREQIAVIERKIAGNLHQARQLEHDACEIIDAIPDAWMSWQRTPSGFQVTNDLKSEKIVQIKGRYIPNTDLNRNAIQQASKYIQRSEQLYDINRKLGATLSRIQTAEKKKLLQQLNQYQGHHETN
jgi:hypothetical protein